MVEAKTDDASFQLCGPSMLQGHDAVRQLHGGFFPAFVSTNTKTLGAEVAASGEMAWMYRIHVNEMQGPDGRTRQPGKWLCVMRKVRGTWNMAAIRISDDS
jgi:ketosteroid isomerase-like protein